MKREKQDWRRNGEKVWTFVKNNKIVLLVAAAGLLLLLIPTGGTDSGGETPPIVKEESDQMFDMQAFETRLVSILADIKGAGKVSVLLTLRASSETAYAYNESTTIRKSDTEYTEDTDRDLVLQSKNGATEPVTEKVIYPLFNGAVIVCEGAGSAEVRLHIVNAVAAVTGLSTDKISVLPMR